MRVGGGLHDDARDRPSRSAGLAPQQRRQRALGDRQLLAAEEARSRGRRAVAPARRQGELEHHRQRALHVGGARGRGRRRRRGGPGGCPGRGRCRGARPAARAGGRGARARRPAHRCRPRRAPATPPSRSTPSTCAASAASSRDSDGTSTSSSVRAARRCARDTPRHSTVPHDAAGLRARGARRPRAAALAAVDEAVVQAVGAALPELDLDRDHAVAAPVRRARNLALAIVGLDLREAAVEVAAAGDDRALIRGPGADLAAARPRRKVRVALGLEHKVSKRLPNGYSLMRWNCMNVFLTHIPNRLVT